MFLSEAMYSSSRQPLSWFWPLSTSPTFDSGLQFETNGFENAGTIWPPPDPERRAEFEYVLSNGKDASGMDMMRNSNLMIDDISQFRRRQQEDYGRRGTVKKDYLSSLTTGPILRSFEAESIADFGVDDEADYDSYAYTSED